MNPSLWTVEELMNFLIDNGILKEDIQCRACYNKSYLMIYSQGESKRLIYRCKTRGCQKKSYILKTKLPINVLISIIYFLMANATYWQIQTWFGISENTIISIKKLLRIAYKKYLNQNKIYLGGINMIVEVDESVLSRRGVIRNPTSTSDEARDTIWIIGAIDIEKNFFLKRIADRRIETISRCLEGMILVGSILRSDGYPSYPSVSENLALTHEVVNHSVGFVSSTGVHTNNIESFWSHLKSTMRKENGVKREFIDEWLDEYTFKRRYIVGSSKEEFENMFFKILKIILNFYYIFEAILFYLYYYLSSQQSCTIIKNHNVV